MSTLETAARLLTLAAATLTMMPPPAVAASCIDVPVNCRVSSPWGMRIHPVKKEQKPHRGMDFACAEGTVIKAAHEGISFGGYNHGGGNTVTVQLSGGETLTKYMHARFFSVPHASGSVKVARGQPIAESGNTGAWTTGPHLHFEVWKGGQNVNPANLFCGGYTGPSGGAEDPHGDGFSVDAGDSPVAGYTIKTIDPPIEIENGSLMVALKSSIDARALNPEWPKIISRMSEPRLYAEIAMLRAMKMRVEQRKMAGNEHILNLLSEIAILRAQTTQDKINAIKQEAAR